MLYESSIQEDVLRKLLFQLQEWQSVKGGLSSMAACKRTADFTIPVWNLTHKTMTTMITIRRMQLVEKEKHNHNNTAGGLPQVEREQK